MLRLLIMAEIRRLRSLIVQAEYETFHLTQRYLLLNFMKEVKP